MVWTQEALAFRSSFGKTKLKNGEVGSILKGGAAERALWLKKIGASDTKLAPAWEGRLKSIFSALGA